MKNASIFVYAHRRKINARAYIISDQNIDRRIIARSSSRDDAFESDLFFFSSTVVKDTPRGRVIIEIYAGHMPGLVTEAASRVLTRRRISMTGRISFLAFIFFTSQNIRL